MIVCSHIMVATLKTVAPPPDRPTLKLWRSASVDVRERCGCGRRGGLETSSLGKVFVVVVVAAAAAAAAAGGSAAVWCWCWCPSGAVSGMQLMRVRLSEWNAKYFRLPCWGCSALCCDLKLGFPAQTKGRWKRCLKEDGVVWIAVRR